MTHGNPVKRRSRFAAATLGTGIVLFLGPLSATTATAYTQADATTVTGTGAPGHVAVPSYYVTPQGERLSVGEVDADVLTTAASSAIPVFRITDSNYGTLTGIHTCKEIGTYGSGVQAVDCADLYAIPADIDPNIGDVLFAIDVYPASEGYCQNAAGYAQCSGIFLSPNLELATSPGKALNVGGGPVGCNFSGLSSSPCASHGRNYWTDLPDLGYQSPSTSCNTTPGEGDEFWTSFDYAYISGVTSDAVFSGQHAIVCGSA